MTAKEKAKELVINYLKILNGRIIQSQKCALILVDEMISNSDFNFQNPNKNTIYWLTVKQEIKNL